MIEKKIVKTVRFKEIEIIKINEFLERNQSLDFSTLVRLSVNDFIESPSLNPIKSKKEIPNDNNEVLKWN